MARTNVFWYRHPEGYGNFGDELNPYIIQKLSGKQVVLGKPYHVESKINLLKTILYRIIVEKKGKGFFEWEEWNNLLGRKIIVAIGSIISVANKSTLVWGAGVMWQDEKINESAFLAVRGKYTQKRIQELGFKIPNVVGDPALLLPLVYQPIVKKKYKIGLMPHYVHYSLFLKHYADSEILIINLLDPIEKIITEISSCEITFSSSLHGVIVSHAYQVPSLWIKSNISSEVKLAGDDIKFADYFSSVELPEYKAVELPDKENILNNLEVFKKQYKSFLVPPINVLKDRQYHLLKVAPFRILKKYFRQF